MIDEKALRDEASIVWLEDPTRHPYLRESVYATTQRQGRVRCPVPDGRLVGYAEVRRPPEAHGITVYGRRVWWLKPYDRSLGPTSIYATDEPAEAVDPCTPSLGRASEQLSAPKSTGTPEVSIGGPR